MTSAALARRTLLSLLASPALSRATRAETGTDPRWLTLAVDIGGLHSLDPARQLDYVAPLVLATSYETLTTFAPGRYDQAVPSLAATWERVADAPAWRFTLWPDATFASGQPVTAEDVAFSLNRLRALGDLPAQTLTNLAGAAPSGERTVDVTLHDPDLPPLGMLASPACAVLERAAVLARNGTERENAALADRATPFLDQHSTGSGGYVLQSWERRREVRLVANVGAWRRRPSFSGVSIQHLPESTAQMRAIERGTVDAAFNLLPDDLDRLRSNEDVHVQGVTALDLAYLALSSDPARNPALAKPAVRQAIGHAIDAADLIGRLLGGNAVRPATFLPIGVTGSTEEGARQLGPAPDLARARALLEQAGEGSGFGMDLAFSDGGVAGLAFQTIAAALRRDLDRVGIRVRLRPESASNFRLAFAGGQMQAALAFWTEPVVDPLRWAEAALDRLGPRLQQDDPAPLRALARRAAAALTDEALPLWQQWQRAMIERSNLLPLFQPRYEVAVRRGVRIELTAAGWMAQLDASRRE